MKKQFFYIFVLSLFSIANKAVGQSNKATYFENISDSLVRLYYDENYFVVDKNCEFKFIERVVKVTPNDFKFDGKFKDFGLNGHTVLEGEYKNGKKDGAFKAYHPNGALKWESTFRNDEINGDWNYYYADGKPMLSLTFSDSSLRFNQYYNQEGQQLIKDGNGEYTIILPIFGFTNHGYTQYRRIGKVRNGLPEGNWDLFFIQNNKRRTNIKFATEQYQAGQLQKYYPADGLADYFDKTISYPLVPIDNFPNAENFLVKDCSFDQYTNFNAFIAKHFTQLFFQTTLRKDRDQKTPVSYKVKVEKNGSPSKVFNISFDDQNNLLNKIDLDFILNSLSYYLPSYKDGKPINDILTISFEIVTKNNLLIINPVKIERENGL